MSSLERELLWLWRLLVPHSQKRSVHNFFTFFFMKILLYLMKNFTRTYNTKSITFSSKNLTIWWSTTLPHLKRRPSHGNFMLCSIWPNERDSVEWYRGYRTGKVSRFTNQNLSWKRLCQTSSNNRNTRAFKDNVSILGTFVKRLHMLRRYILFQGLTLPFILIIGIYHNLQWIYGGLNA